MMARRCDGPGGELSYGVLWEIRGARLGEPHAELGNEGSFHLILLAWGSGNGLQGGGDIVSSEGRPRIVLSLAGYRDIGGGSGFR